MIQRTAYEHLFNKLGLFKKPTSPGTLSQEEILTDGWSASRQVSVKELQIFNKAIKGFGIVVYVPKSVSMKIGNGKSYRFQCSASMDSLSVSLNAIVEIHCPHLGQPYIKDINGITGF